MELDANASTNDLVRGITTVTYGGTLALSNLAGTIAASNAFKLFSANSYSGAFAALTPVTPAPGLAWKTNTLVTDGTLRIVSTSAPTISVERAVPSAPGSLTLSWPADHIGWRLQSQTNSLSPTNWFDVSNSIATNQIIFSIDPTLGSVFYRLIYP